MMSLLVLLTTVGSFSLLLPTASQFHALRTEQQQDKDVAGAANATAAQQRSHEPGPDGWKTETLSSQASNEATGEILSSQASNEATASSNVETPPPLALPRSAPEVHDPATLRSMQDAT
jgi:hypothetical protein